MPPRPDDKYLKLRLRPELHMGIVERAWLNRRSINAEVVLLLEAALTLPLDLTAPTEEQKALAEREIQLRYAHRRQELDERSQDRWKETLNATYAKRPRPTSARSVSEDYAPAQHSMSYVAPRAKPGVVTPQNVNNDVAMQKFSVADATPADFWDDIPPGVEPPLNPLQGVPARMMFQDDAPSAQEMREAKLTPAQMSELVDMYAKMKAILEPSPSPSPVAAKKKAPPKAKPGPKPRR